MTIFYVMAQIITNKSALLHNFLYVILVLSEHKITSDFVLFKHICKLMFNQTAYFICLFAKMNKIQFEH